MFIIAIITFILTQICGAIWLYNYKISGGDEGGIGWGVGYWSLGTVWVVAFLISLNINLGTNTYTGYVYSSESAFGYTSAHIRFSEQAGQDVQPSICVKSDSETGKQLAELTGSGKKVRVVEPPYLYFANNPFACGTTATEITDEE